MSETHDEAAFKPVEMTQELIATLSNPAVRNYESGNWFWRCANLAGGNDIYSSAAAAYMTDQDSRYTDWTALGNIATSIASDGELADVLTKSGLQGPVVLNTQPTHWGIVSVLDIIAAVQAAGCVLTSTGTPSLDAHYQLSGEPWATMATTQIIVNSTNQQQLPNNQPLPWGAYSGLVTFQNAAQFEAVFTGLNNYFQNWKTWAYHGGTPPAWGAFTIA